MVYFYPKADTPGLHHPGVRTARRPRRYRRHRGARDQPGPARQAGQVRSEVRARVPAARRRGPLRRRGVRRVGGEVELRPDVHGHRPLGVPRRREGQAGRGLVQDLAEGHAEEPAGGAGRECAATQALWRLGGAASRSRQASAGTITSVPLWPPKPNEFDSAGAGVQGRGAPVDHVDVDLGILLGQAGGGRDQAPLDGQGQRDGLQRPGRARANGR